MENKTICKNCHHTNKIGANFCSRCGEKIRDDCKCWVLKKDNYSCKERSCPGYKLLTKLKGIRKHTEPKEDVTALQNDFPVRYCGGVKMKKGMIYTESSQFTWQDFPIVKTSFLLDYHDWSKLQNLHCWAETRKFLNQVENKNNQTSQTEPQDLMEVLKKSDPKNL